MTVGKLASMVCMSPQSFTPAFKRAFRTTPAHYVLTERLKWARWLLENTNSPISAIAAETGFSSQSHFTSALKHHTGNTPNELRGASRP
jgi:AraC family transcriptional regulator